MGSTCACCIWRCVDVIEVFTCCHASLYNFSIDWGTVRSFYWPSAVGSVQRVKVDLSNFRRSSKMMLMLVVSKLYFHFTSQPLWTLLKLYCMHRLRRIFGPVREEVTGDWRNVHNSCWSVHVDSRSVVNSRRNQWVRHVACMGELKNEYSIFSEQLWKKKASWEI